MPSRPAASTAVAARYGLAEPSMPRCSMRGAPGHADHLRAVVAAPGRVGRRPGRAGVGRADADALVGVDRRRDDRRDRVRVVDQAGDEVVGGVRQPVAVGVLGGLEEVLLARLVPERDVEVAAVAGEVAERLGHERGELAALLRHDVDHVAEEDGAVAGDERVVVGEVRLELAVRVLVVVRVVAVAELVRVARERRQELVVAVQRLGVVAGLLARIERIVDDELPVVVLAHEEELGLEAHLEAEAELGGARRRRCAGSCAGSTARPRPRPSRRRRSARGRAARARACTRTCRARPACPARPASGRSGRRRSRRSRRPPRADRRSPAPASAWRSACRASRRTARGRTGSRRPSRACGPRRASWPALQLCGFAPASIPSG